MNVPAAALTSAAPAALREEARRYEMLQAGLDLLDQGITMFDADLRMIAWNKPFLRLLEFPESLAYVGAPFESFIRYNAERGEYGPGDPDVQTAERVQIARDFKPHYFERKRPDGRILGVRGEPLPNKGFVTLYTDITEQRRMEAYIRSQNTELEARVRQRTAELLEVNANLSDANAANARIAAALRRSEAHLQLITDSIPALIAYVDEREIYRYVNKGYADRFNLGKADILGRPIAEILGSAVYATIGANVAEAMRGRHVTYEYAMHAPDGQTRYARSTLVPDIAAGGHVQGCFLLSFDITEERRTAAVLMQAQKMEAVGQLTGGLAHDFNNMLTVIIGNLVALERRHTDDAAIEEYLAPALQASRRGVELIRRLLAFSRQQPFDPRPVKLGELIAGVMGLLPRSVPESISVTASVADDNLQVLTDPHLLDSALLNLALNARDAMPQGGRLELRCTGTRVDAAQARRLQLAEGDYVRIDVADTGAGMSVETAARAFEPFFTTKAFGAGSGLGLSMVYGFARQSGGAVALDSTPGRGTVVSLYLPQSAAPPDPLDDTVPEHPGALAHSGELVLLVEDDPEVRRIIRHQLTDLGYPVLEAENGNEAEQMIAALPDIAIVLSDVVMPGGLDGWQLAEAAHRMRPEMRVVLMSGYPAGARARETQALALLPKPFTAEQLAAALAEA